MTIGLSHRLRLKRPGVYLMFCPGCTAVHELELHSRQEFDKSLGYDGDPNFPTFSPAIMVTTMRGLCHFELRAGRLFFRATSFHDLAGKDVELPHFPLS